ncbi:hypothetical protein GIB67_013164 [Kingdonia uniflora]|uniref:Protein kinase domain-containing protein n=1 Tax=Kingdonia uniflora TaxID=39325 RepID=A0A7J7LCQ5_9MAGN|nr:hypothetical protein GIB67_013164 [Kingdonia uniflora]
MKILGCCLETKIPILVYEYPLNKNLSNLLHENSITKENRPPILSWESKLRIITEIADAVTYMHIATSIPSFTDIKSCNIFLGEQNGVKLFGFDLSLKIPSGEEDVETNMSRTIGYIAPECMSGQPITEKCDVYGFDNGKMLSRWQSRRERHFRKKNLFTRNGAILLEEVIKSVSHTYNPYRIFSEKELEIATNCYHSDHILKKDGFYVLYWGNHEDGKISVKKFNEDCKISAKKFKEDEDEDCKISVIDDFVISLQIKNHKNVLVFLGCCLETELPILVYEYSSKENLYKLLHDVTVGKDTLSLENRPSTFVGK